MKKSYTMYRKLYLTILAAACIATGTNAASERPGKRHKAENAVSDVRPAEMTDYAAADMSRLIPWDDALGDFMANQHDTIAHALKSYGLPEEYAFLPFAMTTLDRGYASEYNAGVWGLTLPVARHYGLRADADGYDERFDPQKSSVAAIEYLSDLYQEYDGDFWYTILAFANSPAELNDAIVKNGGKPCSVWEIYSRRMVENVDIVTRMVALMQTAGLCGKGECTAQPTLHTERISLEIPLKLSAVCESVGLCRDSFLMYNPAIRPTAKYLKPTFDIYLPETLTARFSMCADSLTVAAKAEQDSIMAAEKRRQEMIAKARAAENSAKIYKVKAGDTLGHIAMRNNVTVAQLKKWNHLRSDMLQIGQKIKIYR